MDNKLSMLFGEDKTKSIPFASKHKKKNIKKRNKSNKNLQKCPRKSSFLSQAAGYKPAAQLKTNLPHRPSSKTSPRLRVISIRFRNTRAPIFQKTT